MNWLKNIKLNWFEIVYTAISIATFQHTVWAAATVFEGDMPSSLFRSVVWHFNGALIAVAIDVGMFVAARSLSKVRSYTMIGAFAFAAVASAYTQFLFVFHHAAAFSTSEGVGSFWGNEMQFLIDARVMIMPFLLPIFAVLYTLAGISRETAEHEEATETTFMGVRIDEKQVRMLEASKNKELEQGLGWTCTLNGATNYGYKTERSREMAIKSFFTRNYPDVRNDEKKMWASVILLGASPSEDDDLVTVEEGEYTSITPPR